MDRRDLLKYSAAAALGAALPFGFKAAKSLVDYNNVDGGWTHNPAKMKDFIARKGIATLDDKTGSSFRKSGANRTSLLWKYLEKEQGHALKTHHQKIGDCVGQAYGLAIDILATTEIHGQRDKEVFKGKVSTEACYAGSRFEIGYLEHGVESLLHSDGSYGAFAAEFLKSYGTLTRGKYGKFDVTTYDSSIAKSWGKTGIPDHLEAGIKEHPIQDYAMVNSYEDVRAAMANGFPVVFCSSVGFNPNGCEKHKQSGRDKNGFLMACGRWAHAMAGIGCVDQGKNPGVLIQNSWGANWVGGPKTYGQPDGSFWVRPETIDRMCSMGDSYAISGYKGFPTKQLDYNVFRPWR